MITIPNRRTLTFLALATVLAVGVVYDTLYVQDKASLRLLLVAVAAASFGTIFVLQRYPRELVDRMLIGAWPLHLFTISFFWVCFAFHRGAELDQVIVYTLFAYATYVLLPLVFLLDQPMFRSFVKFIALSCVVLTIPAFVGAMGFSHFLIFPLRNKTTYANWSGIVASGGIFEHAEGYAFQTAIGLLCSLYAWRQTGSNLYLLCSIVTFTGLVISQGRAAIFGVALAASYALLPPLFRHSRPAFFGSLTLLVAFPFFIWPHLAAIPVVAGYLRVERGMSGREEAWQYAVSLIEERPITGHGFMASTKLTEDAKKILRKSGFSGAGTTFHNTFITKAVDLGVIATAIYLLLYIVPFIRICRPSNYPLEETLIRSMLLLILATGIFRDYNIGGIRSTAMLGTIFLGLANFWNLAVLWEQPPLASKAARPAAPLALPEPDPRLDVGRAS